MGCPPDFPGDKTEGIWNRENRSVFRSKAEAGENPDGNQQLHFFVLAPDLKQIKDSESDSGERYVDVGYSSNLAHNRTRVSEQRARHTTSRIPNPSSVREHQQRQTQQKGEMNHRSGRVAAIG